MSASSFVVPCKITLPKTTVQEILNSTSVPHVPDRYVFYPDADAHAAVDLPYMDPPIIDLQLLLDAASSPLAKQELLNLRTALTTWGCFQLVNTGIASSLMEQVLRVGHEFFELPTEEKKKYSRTRDSFEGYGNDLVTEAEAISWSDRLHLKLYPVDQRNYKFWPENVPNFSIEFGDDGIFFARLNYYPPCPNPEKVVGLKAHSDATLVTILLQDKDVEALQVLKDDKWYKVPVIPHALVVNVGDQLEILSNGVLKSPLHKAVTNKDKVRLSVASPSSMDHCKEIRPLPELISADKPKLYKSVNNYTVTFLESFAKGERAIEAVKIKY